jgi:hypothetical protein
MERRFNPYISNQFLHFAPPGHYYSPIPDLEFIDRHRNRLFDRQVRSVPGIDLRTEQQLALLEEFAHYYADLPFKAEQSPDRRYYFENDFFKHGDAIALYSMLRHLRPRRVIEAGSGFSSAVMLDTNDLFLSGAVAFTFIEPASARLMSLLTDEDKKRCEIITSPIQDVPLELFALLEPNDVLFIDSSHVASIGSDVVHLLTHVLPALEKGVVVHFHDVFWPFEYPEEWIRQGRAWNEVYMLKAFLQFNASFEILLFNSYLAVHYRNELERRAPLAMKTPACSIWIRKIC